jgi:phosphoglucosamine mutase
MGEKIDTVRPTGTRLGRARRIDDAQGRYIEYVKSTFPRGMRLDGLKIVCDGAHGAAYRVGPDTLRELGAEVVALGVDPDGTNINANCGSMFPEVMRSRVISEKADLGIAFDGDGDRVIMADDNGRLLDGNAILAILGTDMLERNALPEKTIVTTIMANGGLERAIAPRTVRRKNRPDQGRRPLRRRGDATGRPDARR